LHAPCSNARYPSPSQSTHWCVQAPLCGHRPTSSFAGTLRWHSSPARASVRGARRGAHLTLRTDRVMPDDKLHARAGGRQARLQLQQLRLPRLARYAAWPPRSIELGPDCLSAGARSIGLGTDYLSVLALGPDPALPQAAAPARTWVPGPGRRLVLRHAGAGVDKEYVRGAAEQAQAVPALAVPPRVARREPHVQLRERQRKRQAVAAAAEQLARALATRAPCAPLHCAPTVPQAGQNRQGASGRARLVQRAVAAPGPVAAALGRQRHAARIGPQLPIVVVAQHRVPGDCAAPAASAVRRADLGHTLWRQQVAWRQSRTFSWCAAALCAPCRLAEL